MANLEFLDRCSKVAQTGYYFPIASGTALKRSDWRPIRYDGNSLQQPAKKKRYTTVYKYE